MLFDQMEESREDMGSSGCESWLGRTIKDAIWTGCDRVTFDRSFVNLDRLEAMVST